MNIRHKNCFAAALVANNSRNCVITNVGNVMTTFAFLFYWKIGSPVNRLENWLCTVLKTVLRISIADGCFLYLATCIWDVFEKFQIHFCFTLTCKLQIAVSYSLQTADCWMHVVCKNSKIFLLTLTVLQTIFQ